MNLLVTSSQHIPNNGKALTPILVTGASPSPRWLPELLQQLFEKAADITFF